MSDVIVEPTVEEWREMFRVARGSIESGLEEGAPLAVDLEQYSGLLRQPGACFVTLRIGVAHEFRGCMGTLISERPLIEDVSENAFAAGFRDPRFPPLLPMEYRKVQLHLSLLGAPEPMHFTDEADLLRQIQPGKDGLILKARGQRGTFLPSVWEMVPDTEGFWKALKRKARVPENYWGPDVKVERYGTVSASESDVKAPNS